MYFSFPILILVIIAIVIFWSSVAKVVKGTEVVADFRLRALEGECIEKIHVIVDKHNGKLPDYFQVIQDYESNKQSKQKEKVSK